MVMCKWGQNKNNIYLTIFLNNNTDIKWNVNNNDIFEFSYINGTNEIDNKLIYLENEIQTDNIICKKTSSYFEFILVKTEPKLWKYLIKNYSKSDSSWLYVDWDKFSGDSDDEKEVYCDTNNNMDFLNNMDHNMNNFVENTDADGNDDGCTDDDSDNDDDDDDDNGDDCGGDINDADSINDAVDSVNNVDSVRNVDNVTDQ